MMDLRPKLVAASQRLQEPINHCDVIADMDSVRRKVNVFRYFRIPYTVVEQASLELKCIVQKRHHLNLNSINFRFGFICFYLNNKHFVIIFTNIKVFFLGRN
jgi:hypothetical protein